MEINTSRLIIRKTIYKDYIGFYEIYKDTNTAFYAGVKKLNSYIEAERLVIRLLSDPNVTVFSVFLKDCFKLVGTLSMAYIKNYNGIEIGYAFHQGYRRLGLAYESIDALLKAYKDKYFISYFQAVIKYSNKPSIKLIEKLGFEYNGRFQNNEDYIYIKR